MNTIISPNWLSRTYAKSHSLLLKPTKQQFYKKVSECQTYAGNPAEKPFNWTMTVTDSYLLYWSLLCNSNVYPIFWVCCISARLCRTKFTHHQFSSMFQVLITCDNPVTCVHISLKPSNLYIKYTTAKGLNYRRQ